MNGQEYNPLNMENEAARLQWREIVQKMNPALLYWVTLYSSVTAAYHLGAQVADLGAEDVLVFMRGISDTTRGGRVLTPDEVGLSALLEDVVGADSKIRSN